MNLAVVLLLVIVAGLGYAYSTGKLEPYIADVQRRMRSAEVSIPQAQQEPLPAVATN